MCYSAIPGATGYRSSHGYLPVRRQQAAPAPQIAHAPIVRRPIETIVVFSGERLMMNTDRIRQCYCRRYGQSSHRKGAALRKRQHKPDWRHYDKF